MLITFQKTWSIAPTLGVSLKTLYTSGEKDPLPIIFSGENLTSKLNLKNNKFKIVTNKTRFLRRRSCNLKSWEGSQLTFVICYLVVSRYFSGETLSGEIKIEKMLKLFFSGF